MDITIANRFNPFSHRPGTCFLLPKSSLCVQVYPALLILSDLTKPEKEIICKMALNVEGPAEDFTILQDLEKMQLRIWGQDKRGYFRYHIQTSSSNGIDIVREKGDLIFSFLSGSHQPIHQSPDCYHLPAQFSGQTYNNPLERLSLGNHKAQNVDLMRSRLDFSEILPLWHRLGQLVPFHMATSSMGTLAILKACEKAVPSEPADKLLPHFRSLFLAGFDSWLAPRLLDSDFQGIVPENQMRLPEESSLSLLVEGSKIIRSLFIQHSKEEVTLLPSLPSELHCGRFIDIPCEDWGILSMEWSKKAIKKIHLKALKTQQVVLRCSKGEKTCRLRTGHKDRGASYQIGTSIDLVAGNTYWLDNFQR